MRYFKTTRLFLFVITLFALPLVVAQEKPGLRIGGALRFGYSYSDWKPESRKRGGDFSYDVFRLNVNASYNKLMLDAEYRFYPTAYGGGMLRRGWMGYRFDETHALQLGLTEVPFGIMPTTSNNFLLNLNYYVGLEDDADMGLKYCFRKKGWELDVAYFKNADLLQTGEGSEQSPDRYAYDLAGRTKEVHQGNVRVAYGFGGKWRHRIGVSALVGGVYQMDTKQMGLRTAWALHYELDFRCWSLKAQYATYNIENRAATDAERRWVMMAAYGSSYRVAARGDLCTATLSYTIPIARGWVDSICLYNDFSLLNKREASFNNSRLNVIGCLLTLGPIQVYADCGLAKNHAWIGSAWDDAFAEGSANNRNVQFNVNVGYYF